MNINNLPKNIIIKIFDYLEFNDLGNLMLVSRNCYKISKTLFVRKLIQTRNKYLNKFYSEILLLYVNDKYNFNNLDTLNINFYPILFYEIRTKHFIENFIVDIVFKKYPFINPHFLAFLVYEWNPNIDYKIKEYIIRYRTLGAKYNL